MHKKSQKQNCCVIKEQEGEEEEPRTETDKSMSAVVAAAFHDQMISVCISKHEGITHQGVREGSVFWGVVEQFLFTCPGEKKPGRRYE